MLSASDLRERAERATRRPESAITSQDMEWFGIGNLMLAAKTYNLVREGGTTLYRRRILRERRDELLGCTAPAVRMRDGWALDTSGSHPLLPRMLDDAEAVIERRGMQRSGMAGRRFIRDIMTGEDLAAHPSFLDFATSPEIVATVSEYMGQVPLLSTTIPPAVRLAESSIDGQGDTYEASQLYHLDFHDFRAVYVVVLVRDVTPDSGPFTYLGASDSSVVARAVRYRRRHVPYRIPDEHVHAVVEPERARTLAHRKGAILFIDSNRCMHFGSRDVHVPRYQLMFAYVSPCRTDFSETRMERQRLPRVSGEGPLRSLLLDRDRRLD